MFPAVNSISNVDVRAEPLKAGNDLNEAALRKAAIDFETTYIAQMLTFSGLDKALLAGGGEDMSAFTSFYIQSFAENISENGGFGLAESFYQRMTKMSEESSLLNGGEINVEFGKL